MLMNADATYLIPNKVSYEQAAPIFCAGYTVYSGLRWADPAGVLAGHDELGDRADDEPNQDYPEPMQHIPLRLKRREYTSSLR
jgi:NADPH:quinone reductase-like Zn-dependent oxidoreductase